MTDLKLNDNQTALLIYVHAATGHGLYVDNGEFGAWFDTLAADTADAVGTKKQSTATLNQLIKKGVFAADLTVEEGSTWLTLTETGKEALSQFDGDEDEDLLGDVTPATETLAVLDKADIEEEAQDLLGVDVLEGTPADEVADALAELVAESDPAPELAEGSSAVPSEEVLSHTENFTVNQWTEWVKGSEWEWEETIFPDGSRTLKRHRMVSNAWRTSYWGAEKAGDTPKRTTAALAKLARINNTYSLTPAEPM